MKSIAKFNIAVTALAVALTFVAATCMPSAAHAATPSNTYCSADSGVTWLPCASASSSTITPSSSSAAAIAPIVSTSAESSHVLCAAACNFYGLTATNGAAAGYVLLFNATSAPVDGAVTPTDCYSMPGTSSSLGVSSSPIPVRYSTGLTVVYSTTGCFTKTASATAFFSGLVK